MKFLFTVLLVLFLSFPAGAEMKEDTLEFGSFGTIHLYHSADKPDQVVLFVSGDGGWNLGVIDMARELAQTGALVAGIDIIHYLKALGVVAGKCSYPAAHFESLSQYLQVKYTFPSYKLPVLVGYSSGATLVYATLAQSPPNTFLGGISLGFCPDLPLSKPLCKGSGQLTWTMDSKKSGTYIFDPVTLSTPWIALQGEIDQVCDPAATQRYVSQVGNGRVIMLPKVGHGFSVPKNWLPQFKDAYRQLLPETSPPDKRPGNNADGSVDDLPLVELPVNEATVDYFTVILSGDGGWAGIDKELGAAINQEGIPVVGLNSLQYFWAPKTPEQSANDLARIIRFYGQKWGREKVVLIGYSRGADVLPFMINRLPEDLRLRIITSVLLGAEAHVDFQFRVADWLGSTESDTSLPVIPEVERLKGQHLSCIYGADETETSICPGLDQKQFTVIEMKGGHHFGGDYQKLALVILDLVRSAGTE